jgi:hypothetical protein
METQTLEFCVVKKIELVKCEATLCPSTPGSTLDKVDPHDQFKTIVIKWNFFWY